MAVTKRFTRQIVIVTTHGQGGSLRDLASRFGISQAQVARDALAIGLPKLEAKYRKDGMEEKPKSPLTKARKATAAALESPFVSPAA